MRLDTKQKRLTARDAEIELHKSKGATVQKELDLIIIRFDSIKSMPCVKIYKGTGYRPIAHYSFGTIEKRDKFIDVQICDARKRIARKAERTTERQQFQHNLSIGDILYSSWGYDQTNIDFYQITKVMGRKVEIREIAGRLINGEDGFMTGERTAMKDHFVDVPRIRIPQGLNGSGLYIKVSECASAWLWDGKPQRCSWYA